MKQQDAERELRTPTAFKRAWSRRGRYVLEFRPVVIGLATSARNHVDIELEVDDVVSRFRKELTTFFSEAFLQLGMTS